ncbi:MAG: hypothetical protein MNPFHGCM_02873 [Gemmatimonadaceae bacterium]|nr:hypothetical protein [Gemmatimonadaceae bacterium]
MEEDRKALLTVACVRRMGPVRFRELLARSGSVELLLAELPTAERRDAEQRARHLTRNADRVGATLLLQRDHGYPSALLDLEDPPPFLFSLGCVSHLEMPMVAIVGTREATGYGERIASRFAASLADAGIAVVSGLARGIDTAAHRGVLARSGATVAVLPSGVDLPCPPRHRTIHAEIVARGLVVSEHECGSTPRRGSFPRRNRLIAALGAATIVVEAGHRSGAQLTASLAIGIGRPVGAVPGAIDSPASVGTNALIRDGATPVVCVEDILALIGAPVVRSSAQPATSPAPQPMVADEIGTRLWNRLRRESASLDVLVTEFATSPREILQALTKLEVAGLVRSEASDYAAN